MNRLTTRNSMGVAVLKIPYQCERCGEETYRLADYGNGEPIEKLAEYEDLEEQRRLLKLPCAVGDTVYRINKGAKEPVILMKVCEVGVVSLKSGGFVMQIMCRDESDNGETHYLSTDFGKAVFLNRKEVESAWKEL